MAIREEIQKIINEVNSGVLTELNLTYKKLTTEEVEALCEALISKTSKLITANLSFNYIEDKGIEALALALMDQNCNLSKVNLVMNNAGDKSAATLAEAIKHPNCKLIALNLSLNEIGSKGAESLAEAFRHPNCKLAYVDLKYNKILDTGIIALAKALKVNKSLIGIHLSFEELGAQVLQALIHSLESNYAIISFTAQNCYLVTYVKRNIYFANRIGALIAQKLSDRDINATNSFFASTPGTSQFYDEVSKLNITKSDFEKLNQGGYAAVKETLLCMGILGLTSEKCDVLIGSLKAIENFVGNSNNKLLDSNSLQLSELAYCSAKQAAISSTATGVVLSTNQSAQLTPLSTTAVSQALLHPQDTNQNHRNNF